jgi:filamentous hemagglutinin
MAVSQSQIVDLLYKEAFGVTKTDTATNKSPSNEAIPSPALNRGDTLWTESDKIPGTAAALAGIVQAYTGANAVECTADNTTVPIGSVYPTWLTNLTYWIPTEFGSTYNVQVWVDSPGVADPTATGTQIFADGSGGTGQYYYNYQSGVLNFIGETIPAALTSGKVLYIVGYRYIGDVGVTNLPSNTTIGNLNFTGTTITSINTNGNIILTPNGTGIIQVSSALISNGNITAANFVSNGALSITGNANLGNLGSNIGLFAGNVTANNFISNNSINANANITANGNVTGTYILGNGAFLTGIDTSLISNGNSNVRVFANANVATSVAGNANVLLVTGTGIVVTGTGNTIQSGAILANGTVTANGNVDGSNANISGQITAGNVKTDTITAPTGNITISAAGTNENIVLVPTGTGAVDVSLKNIIQLADPVNPRDAATKEYVDSTAQGLTIHTAVRVTSTTNLNATYANGGSVLSTIAITGGKTIQFSAAHNLSVGDEISWDNSFNGIISDDPYFVYSTPAADTITVKAGYFGAEVTTLTNGTGLTQTARANTGVGATLTNAGANAAISIDGVSLSSTNRVLVQGQTNQVENGIYTVTTVGDGSTAWVLTRATDEDTYSPTETNALGYGDYFFVQNGSSYAGSSYVVTTPVGEILFGYTNIEFSQFSAAGSYSAGNGIAITGTTISANVDGVTTDIVGGNIVVKTSAQLTTPNIGAATGTSLNVTGNVDANNLSIGNLANVSGNLTVGGNIFANYAITANANVTGANIITAGVVAATGNVSGGNITTGGVVAATGNVSGGNLTTGGALSVTGNANVGNLGTGGLIVATGNITGGNLVTGGVVSATGNITGANVTANSGVYSNTGDFTGNVITNNLTVNLAISGNTANLTGNLTAANISTGGVLSVTGNANVGNLGTGGLILATGNITGANLITGGVVAATGNVGGANLVAANGVYGNTANITGNAAVGGILTNNYYYANGSPVDFQQAAGANTQVQFNSNNDFGASANFTFDNTTNVLTVSNGNVSTGNLVASGILSVTGNANVGNLGTAGLIVATGNVSGGNLTTAGVVAATGNVSGGNITTGGVVSATGNVSGGNLTTAGALSVTGNANVGNLGTGGLIVATGNVTGGNLVTGGVLSVTGNANVGNLGTGGLIVATGNVTGGNLVTGGALSVTGNANVGNLGTNVAIITTGNITTINSGLMQNGNSNITITANANITLTAKSNATVVITDTGANVAGTLNATGNANVGNLGTAGLIVATGNVTGGNLVTGGVLSVTGNANVGNLGTAGLVVATGNVTGGNLTTAGVVSATGNVSGGNLTTANAIVGNVITANTSANIGNTKVGWGTVTTTAITANQTIAQFSTTGIAAIEFLVKGIDATGSKYSVATVTAVTDGTNVDFATYATAFLGSGTGSLAVNISSGNVALQVTPTSGNSTVWTTQYRVM